MNKVALFDFCETIANFQTADAYVDFVRTKLVFVAKFVANWPNPKTKVASKIWLIYAL